MRIDPLSPVGARVTNLDIAWSDTSALPAVLADHGVVVLPDQEVDDETFVGFLESFGPLMFTEGETPVSAFPDLNSISIVGRKTPPTSSFHVDTPDGRRRGRPRGAGDDPPRHRRGVGPGLVS